MNHLNKLISKDLVIGLPKLKFEKDHICEACQKGKQVKNVRIYGLKREGGGGNCLRKILVNFQNLEWKILQENLD